MDICVGGVDKGSALARFLKHPQVLRSLSADHIEPSMHVAVFGDAGNDTPMFRSIGGATPCVRVAMPHATNAELVELSTHRAEVSTVLQDLCEAKFAARTWGDLRAAGFSAAEVAMARLRGAIRFKWCMPYLQL